MTSSGPLSSKFTLMIPTYNRPAELSRLLTYLDRHQAGFPVLVLDSSDPATQQANKAAVTRFDRRFGFEGFDPKISPWEKFWRGSELVETEFCSLCADDDVIMTDSLGPLVDFLEEHPGYSVAHGWYFMFYSDAHVGVTRSEYRGASLDQDDPVERLFAFFKNYEAVTYAVYRAGMMRDILREVQGVDSMLARELLGGALAVVRGKAARLPVFYYGRSFAPSQPYVGWNPLSFFVSSPDELFRDYAAYRRVLLGCFKTAGYERYGESDLAAIVDIIHLRYLADYVKPGMMDYLAGQMMAQRPKREIMQGLLSELARENDPSFAGVLSGSRLLRRMRDRFFPGIRSYHWKMLSDAAGNRTVQSQTAGGRPREYLFYREFLSSLPGNAASQGAVKTIVRALDNYE